jgi:hypothetical protein
MPSIERILIFLFSPFLSLPLCLNFYGFRHKLVARSFEAFSYFGFYAWYSRAAKTFLRFEQEKRGIDAATGTTAPRRVARYTSQ